MIHTNREIQRPFPAQYLLTSLLGVSAATTAETSGGWIGNNYNSDGEDSISESGRSAWDALYDTTP
jgi:hypothetical protein